MRYQNINIEQKRNSVIIKEPDSFIPSHVFENGQCFRWNRIDDECYVGVVKSKVAMVRKTGDDIEISNTDIDQFISFWYSYFDLGRDYDALKKTVAVDDFIISAIEYGHGMRILRQDFFETLVSFIASQNNNIPRIKKIIEEICRGFGKKLEYEGRVYHSFPERDEFWNIDESMLSHCRAGYRCGYFCALSKEKLPQKEQLEGLMLKAQEEILLKIKGVGPKVAQCVLLFTGLNMAAFPVDTWIKKIFDTIYGIKNTDAIKKYAKDAFGNNAGIAQQYRFNYARTLGIK